MTRTCTLFAAALALEALSACNPVYAPPVRAVHYGAPGRVHEGEFEIGGTVAGVTTPSAGDVHLAYGLHDWVSLELGGTFVAYPVPNTANYSVMAWVGPRFTLPRKPDGSSLLLDGELGVGAGVGGELCPAQPNGNSSSCEPDHRHWNDRTALGGYQGFGLGGAYHWFSLYVRGRLEESSSTLIPVTYWPSAMLGLGFDLSRAVSLDLGGGYLGYRNSQDSYDGWFYQAGLSVRFGR
jgi:hypothetical protein